MKRILKAPFSIKFLKDYDNVKLGKSHQKDIPCWSGQKPIHAMVHQDFMDVDADIRTQASTEHFLLKYRY